MAALPAGAPRLPARVRAVLFDLDGTLLDTAAELGQAANLMLRELGRAPIAEARVATFIGKGMPRLVERCLGDALEPVFDAGEAARALAAFERHYAALEGVAPRPFPGVREGLARLTAAGIVCACVTHKPERFTHPLLAAAGLAPLLSVVVGGDTVAKRKPDPLPILHACGLLGVPVGEALMVGDSDNDTQAARAAGCGVVCVPYGYNEGRPPAMLDCDGLVDDINQLAGLLLAQRETA